MYSYYRFIEEVAVAVARSPTEEDIKPDILTAAARQHE